MPTPENYVDALGRPLVSSALRELPNIKDISEALLTVPPMPGYVLVQCVFCNGCERVKV